MEVSVKIRAFWDMAPCSLVGLDRMIHRRDYGNSAHLWNVGVLERDYTELHARRL
jgi:hypothetical protein